MSRKTHEIAIDPTRKRWKNRNMADWQIHIDGQIHPTTLDAGDLATILGAWSDAVRAAGTRRKFPKEAVRFSVSDIAEGSVGLPLTFQVDDTAELLLEEVRNWVKSRLVDIPRGMRGSIATLRDICHRLNISTWIGSLSGLRAVVEPDDATMPANVAGETTLYGEVVRVGGERPAVRIDTIYGPVTCSDVSEELARSAARQLYQSVRIVGHAEWSAENLELTRFDLTSLEPVFLADPMTTIAELSEKYGDRLSGDSDSILRELRG